ncbi:zinc-dependent metalloprotease [Corynebacterium anserum]|uniref:Hydrolase n=1 Tax=Corynebacterium anserum TaxID=2684406 RepID=A0A7G7YPL7_9CORY|nr:zinc-dependent metalloprotease [Corynebacterium anserum]QNH96437.1 hydrolase [Corynebacterium anserum]
MSNFGFGFHNSDDDSDDDRRGKDNNNNPFGDNPFGFFFGGAPGGQSMGGHFGGVSGGNLGDILSQFGAMFSGMGSDLNSDSGSPVNYSMAERIARQTIGNDHRPHDSQAVAEAVRLAELWLDEATVLPAGATGSVAFGPTQWLEQTLPTWKRIVNPLADKLGEASLGAVPEEMRDQLGPMAGIMKQVNSMNFGMQLGRTLGELAKGVVLSTQWGMPLAGDRTAAIATAHLESIAKSLGAEQRETLIYLAAREAAHHRLFQHVPWLAERLILDVEEFAAGMSLDYSKMEEATREFNPEMMNDPAALQDMMNRLQGEDLSPQVVSANAHARERLETSLSLVEGWVDYVVESSLSSRVPEAAMVGAAWQSFRTNGSPAMDALTHALGLSLSAPKAAEAADLWRRLEEAVGTERRDAVWDHPDFLPVAEDLDNPAAFIGHVAFDEAEMKDFNPISEIERLERELHGASTGHDEANLTEAPNEHGVTKSHNEKDTTDKPNENGVPDKLSETDGQGSSEGKGGMDGIEDEKKDGEKDDE